LAFFFPRLRMAFHCALPSTAPADTIFWFEALAVCSAIHHFAGMDLSGTARRLLIRTDNSNTVNMFNSLRAKPVYNPILTSSVDVRIKSGIDLRVAHIAGDLNTVSDAVSRDKFDVARRLIPGLQIFEFQPPRDAMGAAKK
ncbi:hypothetical protein PLICRDRAFT_66238, partial [Plicaturopsis crispa FD-325 SS-3]